MKKLRSIFAVILIGVVLIITNKVWAFEKDDAIRLVKEAVAYYSANGLQKSLDAFNDVNGVFSKGELYIIAFTFDGTLVANAHKPELLGMNLLEYPDQEGGKAFRKEIINLAVKGTPGWVEYETMNPNNNMIQKKVTYVERAGELAIGCGVYK